MTQKYRKVRPLKKGSTHWKKWDVLTQKMEKNDLYTKKKWERLTRKIRRTELEKWERMTRKNGKV